MQKYCTCSMFNIVNDFSIISLFKKSVARLVIKYRFERSQMVLFFSAPVSFSIGYLTSPTFQHPARKKPHLVFSTRK